MVRGWVEKYGIENWARGERIRILVELLILCFNTMLESSQSVEQGWARISFVANHF